MKCSHERCPNPADEGRALCRACLDSAIEWQRRMRREGRCVTCQRAAIPGKSRCAKCAHAHADRAYAARWAAMSDEEKAMARIQKPAAGSAAVAAARREAIRAGLAAGQTKAQIAARLGISRQRVQQITREGRTS